MSKKRHHIFAHFSATQNVVYAVCSFPPLFTCAKYKSSPPLVTSMTPLLCSHHWPLSCHVMSCHVMLSRQSRQPRQSRKAVNRIYSANVYFYIFIIWLLHSLCSMFLCFNDMHRIKSFHFVIFFGQPLQWLITYRVSKKTAITTFKIIQNAKVGGVLENSGYLLPDGH